MSQIPVMLLPGLLCNAGLFIHQINALKDDAFFFVPDLSLDTDIKTTATRVLNEFPAEKFALGGLSMGGYVALEIMRQAPERVLTLALMDTSALPETDAVREKRLAMMETAKNEGIESVMESALTGIIAEQNRQNEMLKHILIHMANKTGVEGYINEQKVIMSRPDSRPDLPHISCPTLVFGGVEDKLTPPEMMQEIADAIPGAIHASVAGSGHLSPLENPAAVTGLIRYWLKR